MATFSFSVCVKDAEDLASGHKRKKAGDIINVKPAGKPWGKIVTRISLIVTIDGLTRDEAQHLCCRLYPDGREKAIPIPTKSEEIAPALIEEIKEKPLAKNKFCIPILRLKQLYPQLDLDRVKDEEITYQPFLNNNIIFDMATIGHIIFNKHTNDWGI